MSMAIKRVRLKPRTKSMISAPARAHRLALFGPPLLLEGEDEAAYDELLAQFCAAIEPVNAIEEMFVADVLYLEWEILRWRRLKSSLLRANALEALEDILSEMISYGVYREAFEEGLADALQENLAEDESEDHAHMLARKYVRNEPEAVEEVSNRLDADVQDILDSAKAKKTKELAQDFARRKPDAIKQVNRILASSGQTMDDIMAKNLMHWSDGRIDQIERIDRLITIAETRRNASLREIDRRRAALGEAVRRKMQEIEHGQFEVIETMPAEGRTRRDQ
jgi:hypothetical protein